MIFSRQLKEPWKISKLYYKLVGYRSRYNYWTCSDVAKKIQQVHGLPVKPNAATSREWREWEEAARKVSPVGLWISEEGLGILQDIAYFIPDVYTNVRVKLRNAFITRSYMIDTKLSHTEWYECSTRITTGLFNLIVDFVEGECASMHDYTTEYSRRTDNDEVSVPHETDRRKSGLAHLDWEINLGEESINQSVRAKEVKEIYLWISDTYPNRPDPYDVTGWSEYCDNKEFILDTENEDDETRVRVRKMLDEVHTLEQLYKDEDTDYLTRIVKVRDDMWI